MGDYRIKLIATLLVDDQKEKDLVDFIDSLRDRHKLGDFVTAAMRVCWDNPEYLEKCGYKYDTYGMTAERRKFMQGVSSSLSELHSKVDKLYEIVSQLKVLALMNKRLGLEQKIDNNLMATFIMQKQVDDLARLLGVNSIQPIWATDKLVNEQKKAEDALELIITAYDGIVNELKASIEPKYSIISMAEQAQQEETTQETKKETEPEKKEEHKKEPEKKEEYKEEQIVKVEPEPEMDMSDADWDMLAMFVGEPNQ